ncbi:universal stress protein [Pontibacter chitinilyticus]|uniref:universal stress protein n=1 Tax=Pontibacter chitinilyticus TaxID=2674989 RepID=UPI0032190FAE
MNSLQRLLVGLDFTAMDETLIRYAAFLSADINVREVYFVHVEKSLDVPEELRSGLQKEHPGEHIRQLMLDKVDNYFNGRTGAQVEVLVKEGDPLKVLLKTSKELSIDTMMVGRKLRLKGSGVLAQKLLRTSHIGVMFVPEAFEPRLQRVVVSTDFSDYSALALERVLHSSIYKQDLDLICLHVYEVPTGYRTLGVSYEDFDQRMQRFAMEKYEKLKERFPELRQRGRLLLVRQEHQDIGELIVLETKRAQADLLVVGARGKSAAAQFILGSITEKVLQLEIDIPLAVYKKENENNSFLDSFLSSYY